MRPTRTRSLSHPRRALEVLFAVIWMSGSAWAQTGAPPIAGTPVTPPPKLTTPTITLADAVQLTVGNDPQIKLSEQSIATSAGSLQQASGTFDWTLSVKPAFTYSNSALAPSVRQDENNRRLKLQGVATAFGIVNRTLLDQIGQLGPRPPRCPLEFPSIGDVVNFNIDPLAIKFPFLKGFENTFFTFSGGLRSSFQAFKDTSVCGTAEQNTSNSGQLASIMTTVFTRLNVSGLQEATVTLEQAPNEILGVSQQIAEAASAEAVLALNRLGVVPLDEVMTTQQLDTSVNRVFRSGVSAGFAMHFKSTADNFKDKSLDASFGGTGKPIFFNTSAVGTLTVPLSRGRGIGTAAPERAAQLTVSAQTDQWRHTASEEVFRTTLAYLGLVGAQESVRSLEESAQRQGQIGQLTQQQVNSGDIPAVELTRVQARSAAVATALSQARRTVVEARVSLAEAMGVDVETLANAPLAADSFLTMLKATPDVDAMVSAALASRLDVRALQSLRNAAQILEEGAYANARPRLDLSLSGGMSTFYDDLAFYYLPDEVNPIFTLLPQSAPAQPSTGAVRFGSPIGYYRAMFQRSWRPLWTVNFVLDLPWRNSALRGRAVQAEASRQRAEVQERDLIRVVRENVVGQVGSLRRQAEGIDRAQAAVDASQQTVDSVLLRFQQLDQTLIDTLLAEESLTQDRLTLVRLWQAYLSELARLRFETGTILSFTGSVVSPDQIRFDPTDYVRR